MTPSSASRSARTRSPSPDASPEDAVDPRRLVAGAALTVALVGLVLGALLPWVRTGEATRNSFSVVRTARTLDLLDSSAMTAALGLWYFVPALAALSVLVLVLGRDRAAAVLALVVAVLTGAFAVIVLAAPVESGAGVVVALVAAGAVLVSALAVLVLRRRRHRSARIRTGSVVP